MTNLKHKGYDEFDDATKALPWEKTPDFTESCDTKALQGIKVAVSTIAHLHLTNG